LSKQARHPLIVRGFQFSGYHQGKKIISIKAARHSIEKKKIGFFKLGPVYVAKFKDAVIDIYCRQKRPDKGSQGDNRVPARFNFKDIFSEGAMPTFSLKSALSFTFEAVKLNLHNGKSLIVQIQANRAAIKSRDRRVVFQGQVLAISNSRSLTTNKLTLFPDSGLIKTTHPFVFKTSEQQFTGNNLTINLSLTLGSTHKNTRQFRLSEGP